MDDIPITIISIENLSLEIETSMASESNDERFILKLTETTKTKGRNTICWAFYVVNDNKLVDGKILQIMR
jgi:hypothetical protein